jgi:hypothetical protein
LPKYYQTKDGHIVEIVEMMIMPNEIPPYLVRLVKEGKDTPARLKLWLEKNELMPVDYDEDLLPE